mmetsp:Transcript_26394/g.33812  ORF Transcript_26394/g.33812 Transcript_26394/m.33812 type:complete len:97 (-) Transcript_26394:423-713(-)
MLLRTAFRYRSFAELHSRSLAELEYSVRDGIGITATLLCRDTRRFDFDFLDNDELQLACDEDAVKLPRDAVDDSAVADDEAVTLPMPRCSLKIEAL